MVIGFPYSGFFLLFFTSVPECKYEHRSFLSYILLHSSNIHWGKVLQFLAPKIGCFLPMDSRSTDHQVSAVKICRASINLESTQFQAVKAVQGYRVLMLGILYKL